jgi:phenylpropionate dioxygenase-like ring-hydroxylating dioxygenase large terminal subunit
MRCSHQSPQLFAFAACLRAHYLVRAAERSAQLNPGETSVDLADLVVEEAAAGLFRVHRSAMTSTEILRLEQERIFGRSWLYVGHDSEVPEPGATI